MRCRSRRWALTFTPRTQETLCLAQKLFVVNGGDPPLGSLIVYEHAMARGMALQLIHVTDGDLAMLCHLSREANRIGMALLGQTRTGRVSKVAVIAQLFLCRTREHLLRRSANSTETWRKRQPVRKFPNAIEAFGRNEKGACHTE
jgi:hypothetical protein